MIGLDPGNILSWKKYILKHLKCIFKLIKVENTIYIYIKLQYYNKYRFDGTGYTEYNGALLLGVKVPESCCASSNNKVI